jgi:hypothetical protein
LWAGIAQWYSAGLRAGWSGVRVPGAAGNFSLYHSVKTGSGAHPVSYPMGARGPFPGSKAAGVWSWLFAFIWCQGQEWMELYLRSPSTILWLGAQLNKAKGHLYLLISFVLGITSQMLHSYKKFVCDIKCVFYYDLQIYLKRFLMLRIVIFKKMEINTSFDSKNYMKTGFITVKTRNEFHHKFRMSVSNFQVHYLLVN